MSVKTPQVSSLFIVALVTLFHLSEKKMLMIYCSVENLDRNILNKEDMQLQLHCFAITTVICHDLYSSVCSVKTILTYQERLVLCLAQSNTGCWHSGE